MYKCLYCGKDDREVTFTSQEHVFPAGIGGIFQLPKGTVCDNCNTRNFSDHERDFMRNSIISLPRQFYGPGKRGSLNPNKATSSLVHLMAHTDESEERSLGFIQIGKPFQIPQFRFLGIESVNLIIAPSHGDVDNQIEDFLKVMREFTSESKFVFLTDELIEKDEAYFGFWENKYYLCSQTPSSISSVLEFLDNLRKRKFYETTQREYKIAQVESRQKFGFNINSFERVSAKIAFNGLRYLTSLEYCLQPNFQEIRNYILYGGDCKFVTIESESDHFRINEFFPMLSHRLLIFSAKEEGIIAYLNFYSSFKLIIRMSTEYSSENFFNGIICDWRNRQDMIYADYLGKIGKIFNPTI
ncbi:HNH endonuclease [Leptospira levettii]|uniref:HNH endonuclease 5 domain-containing protein n=1 Tax=Leptospira levettii TaxID=2023178 RepID=A0ABY2MTR2_9LEPT|nr:HNH endonuclease [Leptospira levettii]TGL75365.1 hypothetical protein EHQ60_00110 [Leptospira levettii]